MKSKLSWITFVPLLLAAGFLRAARWIFPEGTLFNLSNLTLDYIFIGAVVLVFLFTCLFCVIDRRIGMYYLPHRNIPACIVGLLLALGMAADGAVSLSGMFSSGKVDVLALIESILLIITAVIFVVLGLSHTLKNSTDGKRFSLINVFPALLCAVRMIIIFVGFTTTSLRLADVPLLISYVFATLFFFNYAVVLSLIKTTRALKSCFIFGLPAAAAMIPYGAVKLIFEFDTHDFMNNLEGVETVLIGLYILVFLIELTAFVKDRDTLVVLEDDEEEEEKVFVADARADGYVTGELDAEDDRDDSYISSADTSDYLYKEDHSNDAPAFDIETYEKDMDSYLTTTADDDPEKPSDYESRLDEIDKLILEITEQTD